VIYQLARATCAVLICCSLPVKAETLDPLRVLEQAQGKVVHLRVVGTEAPGEKVDQPIHGSGVIVKTGSNDPKLKFRILTAGHVVKSDSVWAPLGNRVNRDVYVIAEYGPGTVEFRPVTGVLVNNGKDIAQVVAGPNTTIAADLKPVPVVSGRQYVVVSWGLNGDRVAENASAKLVKAIGPDDTDPDLVRLEGSLVPTESGSPVFDDSGAVVAIVVLREVTGSISNIALALPIAKLTDWIKGKSTEPVSEAARPNLEKLVSEASGLCIFLGKRSALARPQLNYTDAPFGREVLQNVQKQASTMPASASFELFQEPLRIAPQAEAINVRSRCPEIEDGKAYYGSVVSQLTTRSQIKVGSILPLHYLDDVFYWARVTGVFPDR
jgi:Trypsin-like peptidase domain